VQCRICDRVTVSSLDPVSARASGNGGRFSFCADHVSTMPQSLVFLM
jgi:hypothetical protein